MAFRVIIPARYESTRLPGKLLLTVAGKPLLQHTYERALRSGADEVIIATDSEKVRAALQGVAPHIYMTASTHLSGTERIAEVVDGLGYDDDAIIVNVQGDEPLIAPGLIDQVAANLVVHQGAQIATLCVPLKHREEILDPHCVKVVKNRENFALYFSRASIPWDREAFSDSAKAADFSNYRGHIGIYAYRVGFLKQYIVLAPSPLEKLEHLEQLRALWHGFTVHVDEASEAPGLGIDTQADFDRLKALLRAR